MHEFKSALRQLAKSPGFTLAAILVLALGVGVNTAIFTEVQAMLLRPLPFPAADRLARVYEGQDHQEGRENTYELPEATLQQWHEHGAGVFSGLAATAPASVTFTAVAGEPVQHVSAARISADFLTVLGISPALGRNFLATEDRPGAADAVLVSHDFWQNRLGGRRDPIGQAIQIDGRPHVIVGIMPPGFQYPYQSEVWVPLALRYDPDFRRRRYLDVTARLQDGVTVAAADQAMRRICAEINAAAPDPYNAKRAFLAPLREEFVAALRPKLLTVQAAALCTLLIAALNFGGLLLSRTAEREGEIAVRVALGAPPARIIGQALLPPLLLSFAGTLAGVLLALWITPAVTALNPAGAGAEGTLRDLGAEARLNIPVLALAAGTMLLVGLGGGLLPALRALRAEPKAALNRHTRSMSGGRGLARLLAGLVLGEIAAALVLLVGTGLLTAHFRHLIEQPWGFATEDRFVFKVELSAHYPDAASRARLIDRLLETLRTAPGIDAAGMITPHPLQSEQDAVGNNADGATPPEPRGYSFTYDHLVAPGYFAVAGQSILQGRDFSSFDRPGAPWVCIVSDEYARRWWPGEDPIGKRVKWGRLDNPKRPWFTVVGVVADTRNAAHDNYGAQGTLYFSPEQFLSLVLSNDEFNIVFRSAMPLALLEPSVREAVMRVDSRLAVYDFTSMEELAARTRVADRFTLILISMFGFVGLVLSASGIYGLISLQVARRTRELGIRAALGASQSGLVSLVAGRGLGLLVAGAVIGTGVAYAAVHLARSQWPELPPLDPLVFAAPVGVLCIVIGLASWLPARRAARADPIQALRSE